MGQIVIQTPDGSVVSTDSEVDLIVHSVVSRNGVSGVDADFSGDAAVGGTLDVTGKTTAVDAEVTGDLTLAGGAVTYGANDSAGAGFRYVRVPNA